MDMQLGNRTALVTGATAGIGHAAARALAAEGVELVLSGRQADKLQALASSIEAAGGRPVSTIVCDLYEDGAPNQLAEFAIGKVGHVDILVNSAGGSRPVSVDAPAGAWAEGMLLNFFRVRELTHAILPSMIDNGWGRIVNITGSSEPHGLNVANSAKAAVHGWAKGLSRQVGKHGITINSIAPGRILSDQIRRMYPTEDIRIAYAKDKIPLQRFGEPEELANLVVFLASPRSSYMTGTLIPVDGGLKMYAF